MKKHRDRIPTPHEVERDLNDVAADIFGELTEADRRRVRSGPLMRAYKWLYPYSLSPTRGEGSSSGPTLGEDGSVTGVTASVAASKEPMRRQVANGAKKIGAMRTDSASALKIWQRAMGGKDEYVPDSKWRPKMHRNELRPLEEAQQRREERNEGYGEG